MSDDQEFETRHGVLHTPESYTGVQQREYHIMYSREKDAFVMFLALSSVAGVISAALETGEELEHVVTIRANNFIDALKRKQEVEDWHRGLTKHLH